MTIKPTEEFDNYAWNYNEAIDSAKDNGFSVIQSRDTLLLLDLDSDANLEHYERYLPLVAQRFELMEVSRWRSQSGKHWHVVLSCKGLTMPVRIALQAVLGSDLKREALAISMDHDGIKDCSWLFKPPAK